MSPNVFKCPQTFSDVPECLQMYPDVLKCSQMFSKVPRCSQMYPDVLKCPQIFLKVSGCLECPQMYLFVLKCTQMSSDDPRCTQMSPNIFKSFQMSSNVPECPQCVKLIIDETRSITPTIILSSSQILLCSKILLLSLYYTFILYLSKRFESINLHRLSYNPQIFSEHMNFRNTLLAYCAARRLPSSLQLFWQHPIEWVSEVHGHEMLFCQMCFQLFAVHETIDNKKSAVMESSYVQHMAS